METFFSPCHFYRVARYSNSWQLIRPFSLLRYRFFFCTCISVPPPPLFIAGRSRWVTATNTLTRYGFLRSRLESRCPVRSAAGAQAGESATPPRKLRLDRSVHDPRIIPNSAGLWALAHFPPPALARLAGGLWRLNHISRKGQSNLRRSSSSSSSPPPAPLLRHGCPVTPLMSCSTTVSVIGRPKKKKKKFYPCLP